MVSFPGSAPPVLLELDLTQPLIEGEADDPIAKLRTRGKPRLRAVVRALHEAAKDPKAVGVIAKIGGGSIPLAIAQEVRAGVVEFARSGKPTVAWSETLGESANGSVGYYLASGFAEVWLQPSGEVGLIGIAGEVTFLRGALDKLGVEPQLDKRSEYKNAADRIMATEFTAEHRESVDRLAESAWEVIVSAIAASRDQSEDRLRAIADRAPLSAAEALAGGLIDRLGYRDEVYADVRSRVAADVRLLFADRWKQPASRRHQAMKAVKAVTSRDEGVVALVEGHGAIVSGRSRRTAMGNQQMGSDTVSAAFRAARADEKVRAVVFRVDSPGGSAVASDTIWREVSLTRAAGKPVVVSMGTMAGSGGYFVAAPADVIVAQPSTLTGSIGVLGGKVVVSDLMDKVGLTTGAVAHGAHSRVFSPRVGFTDDERALFSAFLDRVYAEFVEKVAQGRGMTTEAVHEVAKGRVWSGADAAGLGLVDSLGGLRDAVRIARERADLPADAVLRSAVRVPPVARLRTPRSSEDPRAASVAMSIGGWEDLATLAARLGLPATGPLTMPAVRLF